VVLLLSVLADLPHGQNWHDNSLFPTFQHVRRRRTNTLLFYHEN
jgi:hypothetical protein